MVTYKCTVYRYYGEGGYKKPRPVAKFCLAAIDSDLAQELAESMVRDMPDVFVTAEEE